MALSPPLRKPSSLKNLGPESDRMLREVGIETAEEVRELGSAMIYKICSHRAGRPAHLLWLYALEGAIQDRNLNSFSSEEKAALRAAVEDELEVRTASRR